MFILYADRRINISLVKQYKPIETYSNDLNKSFYKIELMFLNGDKEELYFFDREEERNKFLEKLDKNVKE